MASGVRPGVDWGRFVAELGGIPVITEPALVRQKSRDFFWYSPILKAQLNGMTADVVVCPRDEADVIAAAGQCARWRVPLTVRGGGTGNYGQAVPLQGGVVLDMTGMARVLSAEGGLVTAEPGCKLIDLDAELRGGGWELRMHPSTKRTATLGGFIGGGSGGDRVDRVGAVAGPGERDFGAGGVVRGGAAGSDAGGRCGRGGEPCVWDDGGDHGADGGAGAGAALGGCGGGVR